MNHSGTYPRICATVTARTLAELRQRRDEVAGADLVELRLDTVCDPDVAGALAGRSLPVILTCRPRWEGGAFAGSEEERHRLLQQAQHLGTEFVDVEWAAGFDDVVHARRGRGVVLSRHDFSGVPCDLDSTFSTMAATGAEVIKLAVMARRLPDCLSLLSLDQHNLTTKVLVAMGEHGVASRVLASRFGSAWTYAGEAAAPGQLPLVHLLEELAFREITPATRVYGVVGHPVRHSLSPAMHNAAFRASGMDAVYLPLPATDIVEVFSVTSAFGLTGLSITSPCKHTTCAHPDVQADEKSQRIGAVNTLRRRDDGAWDACNTDLEGFLAPLPHTLRHTRVTVLGAGGAARAVVAALSQKGARITVSARDRQQAADVVPSDAHVGEWPPPLESWDLLVNATPLGMADDVAATPVPQELLRGRGPRTVYDLVSNPLETRLLREARAAGCRTIAGVEMLVAQAAAQFTWWTGRPAPLAVMRAAALRTLQPLSAGASFGNAVMPHPAVHS